MSAQPDSSAIPLKPARLRQRLAAFVYEGILLFGVLMAAAFLFAMLTQQRHALIGRHELQAFLFVVLSVYFTWFWSHGGQTVAMKAWRVRLVDRWGQPLTPTRALARYLLSWLWLMPALLALSAVGPRDPAIVFGVVFAGAALYALLSCIHPTRQFLHDLICGTRLVSVGPQASART